MAVEALSLEWSTPPLDSPPDRKGTDEEEPRSVANIGRSLTHISSASSTMLSRSVLIASPACFRTLPVPAGEAFWNARELTLPGRALTCWVGPTYVSSPQGPCPSHPAWVPWPTVATCPQILLHDLPPFLAFPFVFSGMTSYINIHTSVLI